MFFLLFFHSRNEISPLDHMLFAFFKMIAFRIYNLINEYKQELESVVKSGLFKIRKLRWDRIYCLFQQRSSSFYNFSSLPLLSAINGYLDLSDPSKIRLIEYLLLTNDSSLQWSLFFCFFLGSFFSFVWHMSPQRFFVSENGTIYGNICQYFVFLYMAIISRLEKLPYITINYTLFLSQAVQFMTSSRSKDSIWLTLEPFLVILHTANSESLF